jgi:hypothetical protein
MKKCYSFLFLSCCFLFSANSQILIDGNMSDWNSVPILSEPGVYPSAKVTSDGTSVFYKVDLDASNTFNSTGGPGMESFIDADFSSATGQKSDWLYVSSGNDYFIQGLSIFNYSGTPGANEWAWNWLIFRDGNRAFSGDFRTLEQKLLISDLTAKPLSANYSIAFGYYYSTNAGWDASGYIPQSDANFAHRKSFTIKPRTEVSLSTSANFISGNAYYHPFMNDASISQYLDFQSGATASDNPKQWASWALNLVTPGVYDFKMTTQSTGSGQVQLSLIDMATNSVVKTLTAVSYPLNVTMTENSYNTIDFSDVPAGRYMLKLSSLSILDTYLKVAKVSLSKLTATLGNNIKFDEFVSLKTNSNVLNISVLSPAKISIYALNGKLVADYKNVTSINKELETGTYLVVAKLGEKQFSKKVIIKN